MDCSSIPPYALLRHGTVILIVKMDKSNNCDSQKTWPVTECPEAVERLSSCEQCVRTRNNSQYSDCDSDILLRCRPYRTKFAKRRYVNVCAAVCLLLLVGGLLPQSLAAPHRSRIMERDKRSSDQENATWGNPCDYNDSTSLAPIEYQPKLAQNVAIQARNTLSNMESYKDEFANKLHGYMNFESLLAEWNTYEWMYKWFPKESDHIREQMIPSQKVYGTEVSKDFLNNKMNEIDALLPSIYRGLKMIVAALYTVSDDLPEKGLQMKLMNTSIDVRHVLCLFSEVMRARKLEMSPLLDSEIPKLENKTILEDSLLVYRDTLNYLQYIEQIFTRLSLEN